MLKNRSVRLVVLLASIAAATRVADAGGTGHPHFNDQGTLTWYQTMGEAMAAARAEDKLIFVEYGRLRCGQCRVLCSSVLPHADVRGRLSKVAVGLAANCDEPEAAVEDILRRQLPDAPMLPLVGFLHADGRWITGFSGGRSVEQFLGDVCTAERALAADRRARAKPKAATPSPSPAASTGETKTAPPNPQPSSATAKAPAPRRAAPRTKAVASAAGSPKTRAEEAARRGAWGEVVRLCRASTPKDPAMHSLEKQARAWAQTRLSAAVVAIEAHRYDEAIATVGKVQSAMRGEPEADDAARGLVAIRYAKELGTPEAKDAELDAVRKTAREEMRGTRWEKLFG